MRIPRIYSHQPLSGQSIVDLDENASRHLSKVLRMQAGRELILFDGHGGEYSAIISAVGKKVVSVELGDFSSIDRQSPLSIHLGIGISRGERFDHVLQKATELGVTTITPLFSERTEVKLSGPRLEKKQLHWQQILISSCEQCQRNRLPELSAPLNLDQWLPKVDEQQRFVLHHRSDVTLSHEPAPNSVALAIGPEGGLSEFEIEASKKFGFQSLTLGPRVFRTETAPLTAISLMQYLWGDLS
jgi:16S rRNA (uracil1498-N3)-methyltransferase